MIIHVIYIILNSFYNLRDRSGNLSELIQEPISSNDNDDDENDSDIENYMYFFNQYKINLYTLEIILHVHNLDPIWNSVMCP